MSEDKDKKSWAYNRDSRFASLNTNVGSYRSLRDNSRQVPRRGRVLNPNADSYRPQRKKTKRYLRWNSVGRWNRKGRW